MEQSKLISLLTAKLRIAYPSYFEKLTDEEFIEMLSMYKEELLCYSESVIAAAIKSIIKTNKFMPSIGEIIEACEKALMQQKLDILEKMKNDGYFKSDWELEKTYQFVAKGLIPDWLLNDMKKYGYIENNRLSNNENKLLEVNNV